MRLINWLSFFSLLLMAGCNGRPSANMVMTPILPPTTTLTPGPEAFRIVGYVADWDVVALIPFDKVTHINYAFVLPRADGSIDGVNNPWKLEEVVEQARAQGVKVLISVGGWGYDEEFEALAADPATRRAFVHALDEFARTYELDGIDMDWEYPGPEVGAAENYVALMRELAAVLRPQGKLLTAAVVAGGPTGDGILAEVFEVVDFLNVMAYDGPGTNHSSVEYAVESLDYWSGRGLAAEKMVLGVPFYARPGEAAYSKLVADSPEAAGRDEWEYLGQRVYYNGRPTMARKTELAMARASGVMIWTLGHDSRDGSSLLGAIYETAGGAEK